MDATCALVRIRQVTDDGTQQTNWKRFTNERFAVEFSYPSPTPQGHEVEVTEERADDHRGEMERVHLSSPESAELYLEVARFVGITPQDEYANHGTYLKKRFGPGAVSELTETSLLERPAWTYSLWWPEHDRTVVLLPLGSDTYRIIYDPHSALNDEVIATLAVVE